ncbi:MAG: helix-turn-helix domain-containing protein [bacterium]|nr:helix-turn-helix domain-containing protein [bacterium]
MSEAFESIKQGLMEALEFSEGNLEGARVTTISEVDVKEVRKQIGMTQKDFALSFGISLGTLRHWERGDRKPKGPALVLLNLVRKAPGTVLRLLSSPTPGSLIN